VVFIFRNPAGLFSIRPQQGRWGLWIGDELLGSYHRPEAAADDVYTQHTGWDAWDDKEPDGSEPTDLSEWQRVR